MKPSVYSQVIFNGDCGLSLSIVQDSSRRGKELGDLVGCVQEFYQRYHDKADVSVEKQEREEDIYEVYCRERKTGAVRIVPKQGFSKERGFKDAGMHICLTYWLYFFPNERAKTKEQRDGFAGFMDPSGEKTKKD